MRSELDAEAAQMRSLWNSETVSRASISARQERSLSGPKRFDLWLYDAVG
jgi:hypothetical protein